MRRRSPSSRRAWIEIITGGSGFAEDFVALLAEGVDRNTPPWMRCPTTRVALLAEGVDRNILVVEAGTKALASPSSRRAWIEIMMEVQRNAKK